MVWLHKWIFERVKVLRSVYTLHEFLRVAIDWKIRYMAGRRAIGAL